MQIQKTLNDKRDEILSNIRMNFDFGESIVEDMDGWESTIPGHVYTCGVYVKDNDEQEATTKVTLTVIFANDNSADVVETYVIDSSGNIWN